MLPEQQQRIMGYFIEEAKDHLNTIEQGLLSLQSTIEDPEKANEIFRAAHSVKGGAAMLGLESIQQTAHRMEDYFKILKESSVQVDQALETMFLRVSDGLKDLLEQLEGPFGLTPDKAQEIMADVEPVFAQLESHLNLLVEQADSSPVSIEDTADSLGDQSLQNIFREDVASLLRQLLRTFKQSDTADTRARLQNICSQLLTIGDRFELLAWCDLIETARIAASNLDNDYRKLAPVLIKEIKKAQDLVLVNRASEISVCEAMQSLLPEDILADEFDAAKGDEPATETSFSSNELDTDAALGTDLDLDEDLDSDADMDDAEVDDSLEDLFFSENLEAQSPLPTELDSTFDLTPTDSSIEFAEGLFDSSETTGEDFDSLFESDPSYEDGSLASAAAGSTDSDLAEEDAKPVDQLSVDLEFDEIPLELSTLNRNVDSKEKADESLDALLATVNVTGPAVGTEELNSLADLFDGDLEELDNTLGGHTFISEEMRLNPEKIDLATEEDFMDLLGGDDVADDFLQETAADAELEEDLFGGTLNSGEFADADALNDDEFDSDSAGGTVSPLNLEDDDSDEAVETSFDEQLAGKAIAIEEIKETEKTAADMTAEMSGLSEDVWAEAENDDDLFGDEVDFDILEAPVESAESNLHEQDTDDSEEELTAEDEELLFLETSKEHNGRESFEFPEDSKGGSFGELMGHTQTASPRELDIEFPTLTGAKLRAAENDIDSFFLDVLPGDSAQPDDDLRESSTATKAAAKPTSFAGEQLANDPWDEFSADTSLVETSREHEPLPLTVDPHADTKLDDLWEEMDVAPLSVAEDSLEPAELNLSVEALPEPEIENAFSEADNRDTNLDIEPDTEADITNDLADEIGLEAELFDRFDLDDAVEEPEISADDESLDDALGELFDTDEPAEELGIDSEDELLATDLSDLSTAETDEMAAEAENLFDWASTAEEDSLEAEEDSPEVSLDNLFEESVLTDLLDETDSESIDLLTADETAVQALSNGADSDLFDFDFLSSDADQATAEEGSEEDDGADLDADFLLPDLSDEDPAEASDLAEGSEDQNFDDGFDDLNSLLSDEGPEKVEINDEPTFMGDEGTATTPPTAPPIEEVEQEDEDFGDLERLLEEGTAESSLPAAPRRLMQRSVVRRGNSPREQNMRVSIGHLDNLSNLVGELVVNRNTLERDQERLRQFLDNLLSQVQHLNDVGQRMRDLYERSLLESSLMSNRRAYSSASGRVEPTAVSHATGQTFDALEMDKFTGFHTLSQEMIELIVRVRESASDIGYTVESSDQVTRQFRQITTQLQEGLNTARMVAFSQAADRLPRAVRDISLKCGKEARLVVEGKDTLVDKMIVEHLYDPLTHLVNNAITHGIETPEVRTSAGKSPEGTITVRAFYQGNQTVIYVADDGTGIDTDFIKRKAIERNLITQREADALSGIETYELLFHPGFSTRDQADNFAGRGVGMDVVRTSLAEIRGSITIDSEMGKGTSFTIRLPLTLSISKALSCVSNQSRIAFPMDGVEDMLDVPRDRILKDDQDQDCVRWRDTLLPFQPVTELLKFNRTIGRGRVYGGSQNDDVLSIIVLRSANTFVAVQVDQVIGEQEIVIKQLEGPVPKPMGIAGATVLGDGRVMPIADVLELIDIATGRIRREPASMLWADTVVIEEAPVKSDPTVLIVDDSITVRELLSMSFNKVGYRVEQARDGQEAWDKLRSGLPCDLVFCDIEMPRMDGLELLSRMQKDNHLSRIPIAMLTSRGADRHRQMAVDLGASGYFTKPYLEEALLDAAQRMLNGETLAKGRGG